MEALQECLTHAALALRPDPRLSVSEWADAHRYLSQTASGEPSAVNNERSVLRDRPGASSRRNQALNSLSSSTATARACCFRAG